MNTAFLFLALFAAALADQDPVGILGFKYSADPKAFTEEGTKNLSAERQRAVKIAKAYLALYLDAEVQGRFLIAEADWGFQVSFSQLKIKKGKEWTEVTEGFGEVFLSKRMDRIRIDYGP